MNNNRKAGAPLIASPSPSGKASNITAGGGLQRRVLYPLACLAMMLAGGAQADPPSVTVTYKVTTQAHTCTVGLTPASLTLPDTRQTVFQDGGNTPAVGTGAKVTVTFTCTGTTSQKGYVTVSGTADSTDSSLFANTATGDNVASGLGFILTSNGSGDYSGLVKPPAAGEVTKVPIPGADGATIGTPNPMDFFVQLGRGTHAYSEVSPGKVSTTIHFDTVWS